MLHLEIWLPPAIMAMACLLGAQFNFLLFHTAAELLSIVIAFTAMIVASRSSSFTQNIFVVYVALVIGWCANLDLIHTLVYKGMSLVGNDDPNPSVQLWIAARLIQAVALLLSPLLLTRTIQTAYIHIGLSFAVFVSLVTLWAGYFPPMYTEGVGLSQLKIYCEYFIIFILFLTLFIYWHMRKYMSPRLYQFLSFALLMMILSEFSFTRYVSVYGFANLMGHVLKIFAYWFIYIALVDSTLTRPFSMLSRASSSFDSVPDPTLVINLDGEIIQANTAARNLANLGLDQIIDHSSHQLFHDPQINPSECPVCVKLKLDNQKFIQVIHINGSDKTFECSIAPFLAEGKSSARVQVIRDISEKQASNKRIQELTYLYEMLSETNRAIVRCKNLEELLAAVFDVMVKGGAFPKIFIALNNDGNPPFKLVHTHGFSVESLSYLTTALEDDRSPLSKLIQSAGIERVIDAPLPPDATSDNWINYLKSEGVTARAVMKLEDNKKTIGVFTLYSSDAQAFDARQHQLLQQMASDISFAIASMKSESRREIAESKALKSEHRFSQIFESSPTPVQIFNVETNEVLAINIAFKQWLGFELNDIKNESQWLEKYTLNPEEIIKLKETWSTAIQQAKLTGDEQRSPEIKLRAKDGSIKVAHAAMRLIGDEAIVAWTDLTEIRNKEAVIIESERHFRSMIEQSVAGIYVRRNGLFVYVNSRYCDITGWSPDELIGRPVLDFTGSTPENLKVIYEAWNQLDAGAPYATYTVPFIHKKGHTIEMELHAKVIDWDGSPAHIVLVDDITEKKRQDDQIRQYVGQLEASMKGTLGAISAMVEMRDPYTAGHERRVGIIGRDIAREMGWPEEKCRSLEMIGLVHDIGKISLPAEILTKPSKLSPIEKELVSGHAEAGYQILKDIPFPIPLAEIVREHHERLDGSGYPRGLKGDQILIEARILAVADVIESMASHRPYRPALGIEAALNELVKNRGTLYDPIVVDAMISLVRDKNYHLPS